MGGGAAAIFKGLTAYYDDILRMLASAGGAGAILEYLVIVLAVLNVFKGPIILIGIALWRHKWGVLTEELARAGAFAAGVYTVFDWTDWSLTVPRVIAAVLMGGIFMQAYRVLLARLGGAPAGG
jgi:hypothetical protein